MELLICFDMGKVRLRVQTVPASDPVTLQEHTAYNVIYQDGERMLLAPGWTLRDAIETAHEEKYVFRRRYSVV